MFYFCFGIYLDANFCEKTCKKRDNCKYYDVNLYRKYSDIIDQFDFLVCEENCKYYTPRQEEVQEERPDEDVLLF